MSEQERLLAQHSSYRKMQARLREMCQLWNMTPHLQAALFGAERAAKRAGDEAWKRRRAVVKEAKEGE